MPSWRSASLIFPGFHAYLRQLGGRHLMKITEVQWHRYRLPFLNPFATAHGVITAREGIIVEVKTERGMRGIGEIAPLPAQGDVDLAVARSLLLALQARLRGKELDEALEMLNAGDDQSAVGAINRPLRDAVCCGLEIALLDAIGKAAGQTVCALLAPGGSVPRAGIAVNAVIGASTTEAAVAAAREASRSGFRCVKLKVGQAASVREEVERVAAVRESIGPHMHLRLDANEAWNFEEAIAFLSHCIPYDIQYVEQPLKAHDLAGMRALRRALPIPVAVDEALHGLESARLVLDQQAADILVIKPQLAGGLRAGQQMIQEAAQRGARSVITSTLEAGIGVAAALHLAAASPVVTLECGLATLPLLMDDLLVNDLSVRAGMLAVPDGPGLGVELDWEALQLFVDLNGWSR